LRGLSQHFDGPADPPAPLRELARPVQCLSPRGANLAGLRRRHRARSPAEPVRRSRPRPLPSPGLPGPPEVPGGLFLPSRCTTAPPRAASPNR